MKNVKLLLSHPDFIWWIRQTGCLLLSQKTLVTSFMLGDYSFRGKEPEPESVEQDVKMLVCSEVEGGEKLRNWETEKLRNWETEKLRTWVNCLPTEPAFISDYDYSYFFNHILRASGSFPLSHGYHSIWVEIRAFTLTSSDLDQGKATVQFVIYTVNKYILITLFMLHSECA